MRQFFRIIEEHADQMDHLIGDLLDAGRIEAGMLSVDPEPSEVAAVVDQARNTFLSGGGRHTLQIDLPPGLPRVMVERQRMAQVLSNLFSNASRHSPESSPILVAAERDGVFVALSVADEGRGVPPDQLLRLLSLNAGRVLSYETLLRQLWGAWDSPGTYRVRTFVNKLRGKLGDDSVSPAYILTERGVGDRLPDPEDAP